MRLLLISCLLLATSGASTPAQSTPAAPPQSPSSITIRAARVFDGISGQLLRNAVVEVAGGEIVSVGPRAGSVTHDLA
jgi:hypothetical protein